MKTTVYIGTSLDGFIARKDGNIDWLAKFESQEVNDSYREFISKIDVVVIGRGTFEKVLTFPSWPYEKQVFVLSTSVKQVPGMLKGKVVVLSMEPKELMKFIGSGGAFLFLGVLFMVIGAISEKSAVYISLGALWLIIALFMIARNKQKSSVEKPDKAAWGLFYCSSYGCSTFLYFHEPRRTIQWSSRSMN